MSTQINLSKRIAIQNECVTLTPNVNSINFEGSGINATTSGDNVTVTVPGSYGSTIFYLNETVAQAPYKEFSAVITTAIEQIVPATVAGGGTATIAAYQTPSGVPGTTLIPGGFWQLYLHFNATTAGQNWIIRPFIYKRDLGGIETLILTPDPVIVTNMSTTTTQYISDAVLSSTSLFVTDRIVVKIDMQNTSGVSQTVNFRTEGSQHYSVVANTLNQNTAIPVPEIMVLDTGTCSTNRCGVSNTASGACSAALSGFSNSATFAGAVIAGGSNNTASGCCSTVGGGYVNTANGGKSFIGGGYMNTASGEGSTVSGGYNNNASGVYYTTVSGGYSNTASGYYSTVSGGFCNTTSGSKSTISGGQCNKIDTITTQSGYYVFGSSIGGGSCNTISSYSATYNSYGNTIAGGTCNSTLSSYYNGQTIGGGRNNTTSSDYSTVGGGRINTASGNTSTVSGGANNTASGGSSTVSGGISNNVSGGTSTISGGFQNTASGYISAIGGGRGNTASGFRSSIFGGNCNLAQAINGFIGGGTNNNVCNVTSDCLSYGAVVVGGVGNNTTGGTWDLPTCQFSLVPTICNAGQYSFVGGGFQNRASGCLSTIGGGYNNTASCYCSTVGGGRDNIASGEGSIVGGGWKNTADGRLSGILGGYLNTVISTTPRSFIVGSGITSDRTCTTFVNNLSIKNIPTSSAGLPAGSVWSNLGVLQIV